MIHAVIMAGGKGTRFWPLSRSIRAKQFLTIIGKKSLLTHTMERLHPLISKANTWILGSRSQEKYLTSAIKKLPDGQVLLEPCGRNTAACIGWAAFELIKKDPNATMIVLPSDHYIRDVDAFRKTLKLAADHVEEHPDRLVTIGMPPTYPHTGYGYIQAADKAAITQVLAFKEKPDTQTAEAYIRTKTYFWNTGIFIWKAQTILDMLHTFLPATHEALSQISAHNNNADTLSTLYHALENISVDYGILERTDRIDMIQATFDWNDIGNWPALEEFWSKDKDGNAQKGELLTINSHNNLVYSPKKTVTLVDISDLIVVETDDALLIVPKSSNQKIKDLYDQLPDTLK